MLLKRSLTIGTTFGVKVYKGTFMGKEISILVSLSKLDVSGFFFKFGHGCFSLCKNNFIIGSRILIDGLYKLKLDDNFVEVIQLQTIHKCSIINHIIDSDRQTIRI